MRHKYAAFIRFLNFTFDIFIVNISMIIVSVKYNNDINIFSLFNNKIVLFTWISINISWISAAFFTDNYKLRNLIYFKEGFKNSLEAFFLFFLFLGSINFFSDSKVFFTKESIIVYFSLFAIFFWGARFLFYLLKKRYGLELYTGRKVLLISSENIANELSILFYEKKEFGFLYSGFISDSGFLEDKNSFLNQLFQKLKDLEIEEVFFAKSQIKGEELHELIQDLDQRTIRVRIIPDFFSFYTKPQSLLFIGNIPLLSIRDEPLQSLFNRMVKRGFDVLFSLLVIVLIFTWLFPILALLIKIESKGPIFFKQLRSGRDNVQFWCYKFRSMKLNDNANLIQATKSDVRITKIGRFIRKTSLDEFPQFINVLLGNMSVVGPRPHMIAHTQEYSSLVDKYMIRHFVKPGITGWAQVSGYRGEITKVEDLKKRVEHDIWYIEHWSLFLDFQVILLTVYNIITGDDKAA